MNQDHIGKNVLITTVDWFFAPDGKLYRAVWGELKAIKQAEANLGIRPNGRSINWYIEVGNMTVAGCQVNYCIQTDHVDLGWVDDSLQHEGRHVVNSRPSMIYNASR